MLACLPLPEPTGLRYRIRGEARGGAPCQGVAGPRWLLRTGQARPLGYDSSRRVHDPPLPLIVVPFADRQRDKALRQQQPRDGHRYRCQNYQQAVEARDEHRPASLLVAGTYLANKLRPDRLESNSWYSSGKPRSASREAGSAAETLGGVHRRFVRPLQAQGARRETTTMESVASPASRRRPRDPPSR